MMPALPPVVVVLARRLPGPPELVWDLLTDWERQGDWMLEATDFAVLSEHREGVGVEARATVRIGGISTTDTIRVTEWRPARRLRIAHLGWVKGEGDVRLTPLRDGGTLVAWRETLCPPLGPLGWAGMWLYRPLMVRTFERDLRVLEDLVRVRAGPVPHLP